MKNRFLSLSIILAIPCNVSFPKREAQYSLEVSVREDTVKIQAAFNENDLETNEYLQDRLKPIRSNFKRINSIVQWSSITKKNIEGESAEGGEATFYYRNKCLEKIMARHYGETGQLLIEYYLLNGRLSFVFEKNYQYNRPLFYDIKAMKENNDTEAFDFEKSKVTETRTYFEKGNLIYMVNSRNRGTSFSRDDTHEEKKRITEDFERLLKLLHEK